MDDEEEMYGDFTSKGGDAAFLYVLFTFQFFVTVFGIYMFFRKLCGSPEYKKEKKVTAPKLCIQVFLIALNLFWMNHTYKLIQLDQEMKDQKWDPYTALELEIPTLPKSGFGTPEVKQAFKRLAKKYHPDKVREMPLQDQEEANKKF